MGARVLIIGAGDAGQKIADGLARSGKVDQLILSGLCQGRGPDIAGMLTSCYDCKVRFIELDGTQQEKIEQLLRMQKPDLVIQSASLLSPWAMYGRTDAIAKALSQAGLGVQLPAQLPILTAVMKAVRELDFRGPVANLSYPDITHVILDRFGLAPTIGLGNVSISHLRVRAALRNKMMREDSSFDRLPLVRLVGHHNHVYGVMEAQAPDDPNDSCRVYIGEEGQRADELAYQGFPITPGIDYNIITAAAALPVLLALLPGAETLRFSAPAPRALPGGYPVMIREGKVHLDLPKNAKLQEAVDFHWRISRQDGIETVTEDGTIMFSEKAKRAVARINPALCEPLTLEECMPRYQLLMRHLNA
ncbi:MAG: hypothetical protein JSV31_01610 [Desulfobacterales bacterium]|nr:MAG: hypothetical protein JSV31_01610 [Desulfobacterales bacterium]